MQSRFNRRAMCGVAAAASMLLAGAAQAALQDRDLNGDAVVDAFYDTDLDITWLRGANVNGGMNWHEAVAWADGYSFGSYSDWRLPKSDTCLGHCTSSEMGHLWHVELGNPEGGPMTNSGNFQNLQSDYYWSGTEYEFDRTHAWYLYAGTGYQLPTGKINAFYALAAHPGDVGIPVVPEPQTLVLMLAGLTTLALVARRRPG